VRRTEGSRERVSQRVDALVAQLFSTRRRDWSRVETVERETTHRADRRHRRHRRRHGTAESEQSDRPVSRQRRQPVPSVLLVPTDSLSGQIDSNLKTQDLRRQACSQQTDSD